MNNMRSWQTRGASLSARRSESSCAMLCLLLLAISCVGCANGPPQSQWLSYEQVRPELRRKIGMERQDFVRACGRLVNVGGFRTADDLAGNATEEIVIADGASNYYDRRTAELVAACGFWDCTRDPRFCQRSCPLREWTCSWD